MRVLLLTQIVPYPPDSGPKIKTYNVLRYLAQRHEVHLASFSRSPQEEANARSLRQLCASVTTVPLRRSRLRDIAFFARSTVTGRPFLVERDDSAAMRSAIWDILGKCRFDAVHADQLSMAEFAVDLPIPLRVLDEHNAVWTIVRRAAAEARWGIHRLPAEIEWRKLKRYEGEVCRRFDLTTVVSRQDYAALAEAAGADFRSEVIPIAVDTKHMTFLPRTLEARHIVSVATMFYPPNVEGVYWFARKVFPLIRRQAPLTHFFIVGSRPPAKVCRLARPGSRIGVTGYVGDLEPVLRQSAVMVVPVHSGSGMRVKILEAFARGIPVVSTTVGIEGIDALPDVHLLVADDPDQFARAVVRVLEEPQLARRLAEAARAFVEAHYDWRTALAALDNIYQGSREPASLSP
ncbi:MAG: glycosyltransferase [Chloroflexota bacterium]